MNEESNRKYCTHLIFKSDLYKMSEKNVYIDYMSATLKIKFKSYECLYINRTCLICYCFNSLYYNVQIKLWELYSHSPRKGLTIHTNKIQWNFSTIS